MREAREDNKLVRIMELVSDLFILNLLTLICCLPVITAGAAFTAMHSVLIRIIRKESGYVAGTFFRCFREEFVRATAGWGIFLLILVPAGAQIMGAVTDPGFMPKAFIVLDGAVITACLLFLSFLFPLMARFRNTLLETLKNAMTLTVLHIPVAFGMAAVGTIPLLLFLTGNLFILPFVVLFGFSVPGYICVRLYDHIFKKMEGSLSTN
ncbi:Uncharacterized membrane protein YesL [Lachnospiraceae bacterium]|nr:Uncharacterized membrane protein YesL [Lachnospiraceae bacterium]